ncbi:MAG: hypothetical protein KIT35_01440 [Piscinibacter sp.]|uniref:hypothetical protein n=1 Tax=Piscinibacter sp. TaxID=1903157 RepID=UPI00258829F7|nr:hypothetical protein [Piscinibacter sp.]MCW5662471.1 hypothetical protein [Piscinibacter sp.]
MKHLLTRLGWLVAGALGALIALELLFRLLPVSMGLQRAADTARWPLVYAEPHSRYAYSLSWSMRNAHRGMTNNYGHIAEQDFVALSRPVLVLGDSFIESLMNDPADTLQAQLGRRLGDPSAVYGLGVSGLSASGYVALGSLARTEFAPRAAVIAMIDGDLSESLLRAPASHYLVDTPSGYLLEFDPPDPPGWTTRVRKSVGDSALFRYLQANLQFAPANILKRPGAAVVPQTASPEAAASAKRVVDWMLEQLPASLGLEPRCIVLLLDSDRYAIYRAESATPPKDAPEARRYLVERARQLGFSVSDLEPVFRARHARDGVKFDHWPIDRHWNRVGHGVAADEAYRLLAGADAKSPGCLDRNVSAAAR